MSFALKWNRRVCKCGCCFFVCGGGAGAGEVSC